MKEIIEQAYLKANKEFQRIYENVPVPAEVTFGADQLKKEILDAIEDLEWLYEKTIRQQHELERPR